MSRAYNPESLPDQFFEAGIYGSEYVHEGGLWKIKKLGYIAQCQANYEKSWARDDAHLQPLTTTFPEHPLDPDKLLWEIRAKLPDSHAVEIHYQHTAMAKKLSFGETDE